MDADILQHATEHRRAEPAHASPASAPAACRPRPAGWRRPLSDLDRSGRVRPVVCAPDPRLSRPAALVDPLDPAVVRLAADLMATMRLSPGCVGLAAPQIGIDGQVFVVDVRQHPKTVTSHGAFALCNATVVQAARWRMGREGCLSLPHLTGDVKRASRLVVEGVLPGTHTPVRLTTDAFEARVVQHELDHCSGLLFRDRVSSEAALFSRQVYL